MESTALEIILKEKGGAKTEERASHVEGIAQAGAQSMLVLVGPGGKEKFPSRRLRSQAGKGLKVKKKVRGFFFLRSLSENNGLLIGALTTRTCWNCAKRMP